MILVLLAAASASAAALNSTLNSTNPLAIINNIDNIIINSLNIINNFLQNISYILKIYIIKMSETAALIMAMVGAFLYFTRLSKYTGRSLLVGAVLLYIFSEVLKAL